MIDATRFEVTKEFDSMYPEFLPVRITVKTESSEYEKEVTVPKGHFRNPYDWKDLENKGRRLIGDQEKVREIIEIGKKFESTSVRRLFEVVNFS